MENIYDYFFNIDEYWPITHQRNVIKFKRFLSKGAGIVSEREYINEVIALAKMRERFCPQHVYIINAGSSGSHWLEAMLGMMAGFHNGGEIYLPNKIINKLRELNELDAKRFIDTLYLFHAGKIFEDSLYASLSNSAHLADHTKLAKFSLNHKAVLLLRNPVDIALSRTFRKDEYKNSIAANANDKEYLERNCNYVHNFYRTVDAGKFSKVIKYEELRNNPFKEMRELLKILDIDISDSELHDVIEKTSERSVKSSIYKGENPITNVYTGIRKDELWARDYATKKLKDIAKYFGY